MVTSGTPRARSTGAQRPPARNAARERRFAEALRAQGRERSSARGAQATAGRASAARRAGADAGEEALLGRRETFREAERAPPAQAAMAPDARLPRVPEAAPCPPELRALVRALPPALEASRVREGAPLSLSFGRSLEVELRPSPGGVEVVLRPEPRLARSCADELPRVVAALAARGVSVARAEVRPRPGGGRPRVDVPPPLR